jgi:glycosyltransferase involved in cell wall biosynthesis
MRARSDYGALPLVTVIIPAYNEALKLHDSLTTIYAYLQSLSDRYRFEVLVVDDGSTDGTDAIAAAFAGSHTGVRVLTHAVNFRLGQALMFAFGQSRGDYVVVFDSDLSYTVDHIGRMLEAIEREHARVVVASPYMKGGKTTAIPWRREAMSKGVNRLLAATSQGDLHTVTGMVRCYDGIFIRSLDLKSMGPEINTEILYKAQIMRARIIEIPAHLDWTDQEERMASRRVSLRVSTTSKLLMFSSFLFRPIFFFLIPGVLLFAVAVWTLGSVAWTVGQRYLELAGGNFDYRLTQAFQDTYQARPHSFIVGGFALVIAVQLVSLGLLATQTKRYFEETFHLGTSLTRRLERMERAGWAVDLPEVVPARLPEPAPVETAPAVAAATAAKLEPVVPPTAVGPPVGAPGGPPQPIAPPPVVPPPVVPVAPRVGVGDVVGRHASVTSGDTAGSLPG